MKLFAMGCLISRGIRLPRSRQASIVLSVINCIARQRHAFLDIAPGAMACVTDSTKVVLNLMSISRSNAESVQARYSHMLATSTQDRDAASFFSSAPDGTPHRVEFRAKTSRVISRPNAL